MDSVNRNQRFGLLMIALTVVVFTAHSTQSFLLIDACLDAGGRYLSGPPRCDFGGGAARKLASLPRRSGAWLLALGPAAMLGYVVYVAGRAALRRASRDAG
jgi:hypothetical protein